MKTKTAIVTGASRGIGYAIAGELAGQGYSLGLTARTKADIENAAAEIKEKFQDIKIITGAFDAADGNAAKDFVKRVSGGIGDISVLVNNAGYYTEGTSGLPMEEVKKFIDVNYYAAVHFTEAVLSSMKKLGYGHIFNIASVCGVQAFADVGSYSASKFALVGYSSALAQELAPVGIKVTAICPSWVDTKLTEDAPVNKGEMIKTEDIALTVRYLLSLGPTALVREIVIRC